MKRIITTLVVSVIAVQLFAMAGFADRWLAGYIYYCYYAATVLICQLVSVGIVSLAWGRIKTSRITMVCNRIASNPLIKILVGGFLFSAIVSPYMECVGGAFFLLAFIPLLIVEALDCIIAFVSYLRKHIVSAKAIFYMSVMFVAMVFASVFYYLVLRYNWLEDLYSYSFYDVMVDQTIYPTMFPINNPSDFIYNDLFYFVPLFIPWVLCFIFRSAYYLIQRYL